MMPTYRTKGDLRSSLLVKLGYGGLGSAAGNFVPMADELLDEAQEQLFILMPDEKRVREWDWTTGINQRWYDFPADCDKDRIMQVSTYVTNVWIPLDRGIGLPEDSYLYQINNYPMKYDIRYNPDVSKEQIEVWPVHDSETYPMKIEGYIQLMDFSADGDRATVDDTLILLYAEAFGKAHLNRPDAQLKMNALQTRLRILRGQQHGEQRYIRGQVEEKPIPIPKVV
jgi:hypothetical protein